VPMIRSDSTSTSASDASEPQLWCKVDPTFGRRVATPQYHDASGLYNSFSAVAHEAAQISENLSDVPMMRSDSASASGSDSSEPQLWCQAGLPNRDGRGSTASDA
ncbi:unnamed protein product, partial [Symbiodinium sp. CCMP2592]